MKAFPRERFSAEVALSTGMVAAFAIHHDPAFAAKMRYARIVESRVRQGPHFDYRAVVGTAC